MSVLIRNIYKNIPCNLPEEIVENISSGKNIKIERIVSRGHSSSEEFWYDQKENEFVLLIKGKACILFEGEDKAEVIRKLKNIKLNYKDYGIVEQYTCSGNTVFNILPPSKIMLN